MKLSNVLNHQHWIIRFSGRPGQAIRPEEENRPKCKNNSCFSLLSLSEGNPRADKYYILLGHNFWKQVWDKNGMLDINNTKIKLSSCSTQPEKVAVLASLARKSAGRSKPSALTRTPPEQITFSIAEIHQNNQIPFKILETSGVNPFKYFIYTFFNWSDWLDVRGLVRGRWVRPKCG